MTTFIRLTLATLEATIVIGLLLLFLLVSKWIGGY